MSAHKITFSVKGMTCESCAFLITETLKEHLPADAKVGVSLSEKSVTVEYEEDIAYDKDVFESRYNTLLHPHGYSISAASQDAALPQTTTKNTGEHLWAMCIASCFVGIFLLLQKS